MTKFIVKRIFYMLAVLFCVVTITFFLVHSIPGDPISSMVEDLPLETRDLYLEKYGFDQPIFLQYIKFIKQLAAGDLGQSLRYPGRRVVDIVKNYAPVSGMIGGLSLLIGFAAGIVLGIVAALKRNQWSDRVIMVLALLGTTIPTFVVAAVLQYALTVTYPLFPHHRLRHSETLGFACGLYVRGASFQLRPLYALQRAGRDGARFHPDGGGQGRQPVPHRHPPFVPQFLFALRHHDLYQRGRHFLRLLYH